MSDDGRHRLEAEFATLLSRAGISLPRDRREAVLRGFLDMQEKLKLLHAQVLHSEPMYDFAPLDSGKPPL